MAEMYSVYIIFSNLSGKPRIGYTSEASAKKNKKMLEHVIKVIIKDEWWFVGIVDSWVITTYSGILTPKMEK